MRSMPELLWYKCHSCGNEALASRRPKKCHALCDKPDWYLMRKQKAYQVGHDDWEHPNGE